MPIEQIASAENLSSIGERAQAAANSAFESVSGLLGNGDPDLWERLKEFAEGAGDKLGEVAQWGLVQGQILLNEVAQNIDPQILEKIGDYIEKEPVKVIGGFSLFILGVGAVKTFRSALGGPGKSFREH